MPRPRRDGTTANDREARDTTHLYGTVTYWSYPPRQEDLVVEISSDYSDAALERVREEAHNQGRLSVFDHVDDETLKASLDRGKGHAAATPRVRRLGSLITGLVRLNRS